MRRVDDQLELVACGSSHRGMPTFGTWERVVLERCFDLFDHISAHAYYEPLDGDVDSFLASGEDMHRFIESVVATADHVAAVKGSDKRIMVSFDEWNVWFQDRFHGESSLAIREAPELIEDVYDVTDAVVVGSLLITLLQHTDRVSMACQAQLVNVIAPIATRPGGASWKQTIFHPFALTAQHARGTVLRPAVACDTVETKAFGPVDQLVVTATHDPETGDLAVFVVNRSRTETAELTLDVAAAVGGAPTAYALVEHLQVHDDDTSASNTEEHPDRVTPHAGDAAVGGTDRTTLTATLPPTSWHCIRLTEGTVQ
jgi:alpha-N-arabinofuranosidase